MDGLLWMRTRQPMEPREGGVEVEGAVKGFPSGEEGSDGGLAEKVEGEFGLRENFVPQVVWEG